MTCGPRATAVASTGSYGRSPIHHNKQTKHVRAHDGRRSIPWFRCRGLDNAFRRPHAGSLARFAGLNTIRSVAVEPGECQSEGARGFSRSTSNRRSPRSIHPSKGRPRPGENLLGAFLCLASAPQRLALNDASTKPHHPTKPSSKIRDVKCTRLPEGPCFRAFPD
jgi:hypothetical protein